MLSSSWLERTLHHFHSEISKIFHTSAHRVNDCLRVCVRNSVTVGDSDAGECQSQACLSPGSFVFSFGSHYIYLSHKFTVARLRFSGDRFLFSGAQLLPLKC